MELIVNGKRAVLKKGSSFDYVSENRSFGDADDYTLSITLPLAGCPENIAIFGRINRADFTFRRIVLDASLTDNAMSRHGVVTVVAADESEIKVQFLEGRSVQNFDTSLDEVYINELDLGEPTQQGLPETPSYGTIDDGCEWTYLPWWNESGNGAMNNEVLVDEDGRYYWSDDTKAAGKVSCQLYLIECAKRICRAIGYTFDFTAWEQSDERFLLICNALPAAWDVPGFARALPHWSVAEFFEELEKILVAEFDIDNRASHISMTFTSKIQSINSTVRLENVTDSLSAEVSYDDALAQYKGSANIMYADRGDSRWKLEQCQWLIDIMKSGSYYQEFATLDDYIKWKFENVWQGNILGSYVGKDEERSAALGMLSRVRDFDRYFIFSVKHAGLQEYPNLYMIIEEEVNRFGGLDGGGDVVELKCLPAYIDSTDYQHQNCIFLSPAAYNESTDTDDDGVRQPVAYSMFMRGEDGSAAEYYGNLYLAYWDGTDFNNRNVQGGVRFPPCPCVDQRFSLRNRYAGYLRGIRVDASEKMKLSWIASQLPDVRSVFFYAGKKYLCAKITATFTENGMSQLLKGEFYRII